MPEFVDPVLVQVNEQKARLSDILKSANAAGRDTIHGLFVRRCLVFQIAQRQKVAISNDTLQEEIDEWRRRNRLESVEKTREWLLKRCISFGDLVKEIRFQVLEERLKAQITPKEIQASFAREKLALEVRDVCWILIDEYDAAEELAMQIRDKTTDFYTFARLYSLDENTRPASGYLGRLRRRDLPNYISSVVFGADSGDVVGPIQVGRKHALYYIHQILPAKLDENTRVEITGNLYEDALKQEANKSQITYPYLNSIRIENPLPDDIYEESTDTDVSLHIGTNE